MKHLLMPKGLLKQKRQLYFLGEGLVDFMGSSAFEYECL